MNKIARTRGDKVFDFINYTILTIILLIVLYPLYLIIISSISDPIAVNAGKVNLLPKGLNFKAYELLFNHDAIWRGYLNSIIYVVLDVAIALTLILPAGYALSRTDLAGRNFFMFMIIFTMFFSGGLIPLYMLVQKLGMINTIWALILPSAVGAFHILIVRTFFQTNIPIELLESAKIDGCSDFKFFLKIVLPLSTPIIAVMALFNAVTQWNSYFPALIYLQDQALFPLQLILQSVLLSQEAMANMKDNFIDPEEIANAQQYVQLIKYALIIVASLPMLILYPFLQKYFVKGVMIGSVKG